MDLVTPRLPFSWRTGAMSLPCAVAVSIVFSLGSSATVFAQLTIEPSAESTAAPSYKFSDEDVRLLDEVQKGCFQYFWNEVGHPALLAKDKTTDSVCSTAAVGFQLSSLPIGVEAAVGLHENRVRSGQQISPPSQSVRTIKNLESICTT